MKEEAEGELKASEQRPVSFVDNVRVSIKRQRSPLKSSEIGTGGTKTPYASMFPKEETKAHIAKCFAEDISFSKIEKLYRRDYKQVNSVL